MARDPYAYFRVEVHEITGACSQLLLALDRGDAPADAEARLFRHAHTLKGAAAVVRQAAIVDLAHLIEDVLAGHRSSGAPLSRKEIGELLQIVDAIDNELGRLDSPAPEGSGGSVERAPDEHLEVVRVELTEMESLAQRVFEAEVQMTGMRTRMGEIERVEALAAALLAEIPEAAGRRAPAPSARSLARTRAIAAELREVSARAQRGATTTLDAIDVELRLAREQVETLRLMPAGAIFPLLERAARGAADSLGRAARIELQGGSVRVDRHVLSAVRDALIHVVRNAVDHGIEPADERSAAGKPPVGRVVLRVERRGRRVSFVCEDDGRGIDREAILRAAVARGLVSEDQAAALDDDGALRLALRPGLSTTAEVTDLSGRGMGLDVVRSIATRFKGDVTISSRPGRGTSVALSVPVSMTALPALAMQAGETTVLAPLDAIVATLRLREHEILRSPGGALVLHEGESVPFVPLTAMLQQRAPRRAPDHPWAIVLLRASERTLALGVDRVQGITDVVIQALPPGVEAAPWIAGAVLDSEGNPVLVLDPQGLAESAPRAMGSPAGEPPPRPPRIPILVVDDSLTTRMLEQSILQSAGYEVDLACSGEEALVRASARRYGLFIVDIEMPGMNGFEFTAKTRSDAALRGVPIILVTSLATVADKARGIKAGAAAYIVKGEFDQRRFLQMVGELVGVSSGEG